VDLTVVRIEPGLFQQGSSESETGRNPDETKRYVTISRAFYLGKSPVTRGQFARFVSDTNYRTEAEKGNSGGFGYENGNLVQKKEYTWRTPGFPQTDNDPVVIVTWNDAQAFAGWLSRKSGSKFELPSEAQWEYACRAGGDTPYGGALTADEVAWHKGNSGLRTHPVGEKAANAWGLTDMLGNVWEWCADWYGPYAEGPILDPVQNNSNLSDKPRRVLRGGSWLKDPAGVRVAARFRNDPQSRNPDNGFRVMTYALDVATAIERLSAPSTPSTAVPPAVALNAQSTPAAESLPQTSPAVPTSSNPAPLSGFVKALSRMYGGLGCFCVAIVVVLFFIRRAFRGGGSTSVPQIPIPGGVQPPILPRPGGSGTAPRSRIVDDGFWIEGGNVAVGTPLKCRYVVGGVNQEKDLTFESRPGGQFIYTGQRPSSVSIIVLGAAAGLGAAMGTSMFDDDDDERDRRERLRREQEEEERRRRRRDDDTHSAY
jgi:formylglycine-generating enzyme required for sulfatase activity